MPRFKIDTVGIAEGKKTMDQIGSDLETLQQELVELRKNLGFRICRQEDLEAKLENIENQLVHQRAQSVNLSRCMGNATARYCQSERAICKEYGVDNGVIKISEGGMFVSEDGKYTHKWWLDVDMDFSWVHDIADKVQFVDSINPSLVPLILNTTATILLSNPLLTTAALWWAAWNILPKISAGFEINGENSNGVPYSMYNNIEICGVRKDGDTHADNNLTKAQIDSGASGKAEVSMVEIKHGHSYGVFSEEYTGRIGSIAAWGKAGCALGLFGNDYDPKGMLKAEGEGNLLSFEKKTIIGSEKDNIHSTKKLAVGDGDAEVKVFLSEREGTSLKGGLTAALASYTETKGATISGINVEVEGVGDLGSVGAEGGFELDTDCAEVGAKAGAGAFGLGGTVRISHD